MQQKISNKCGPIMKNQFSGWHDYVCKLSIIIFIFICSWFQLQFSCIYDSIKELFKIDIKYILLNLLTGYVVFSTVFIIINRLWLSCFIFSILTFLVSAVNYYVIQLHSSPLTVSELANFKTALNVIGGYDLKICKIIPLAAIFILECILCLYLKRHRQKGKKCLKNIIIRDSCLCLVSVLILFLCYFMPNSYMPKPWYWSWTAAYQQYGYMPCTIANAYYSAQDVVKKPDGYYKGCVKNIKINRKEDTSHETPEIILILNETFYDLSIITDLKTDIPYMEYISSMENTIKGYAVNPAGGTNPSEYELLTSNSMKLMHREIPFNIFGEYDEEVDEYLSCIRLSDQAFKRFTDKLKNIDRDIIVCMVGDHGPYLTGKIVKNPESEETLFLRTSVSFVIWANYDIEDKSGIGGRSISMNYLVPALLNTAGVKLSPYYDYMLDLKKEVPVLTAYNGYYDKFGNLYDYHSSSRYTKKVNDYFYLEYNNLKDDREQSLFDAY